MEPVNSELKEIIRETEGSFKGLICAFDLKGRVLYVNERIRFLSGIEGKSFKGRPFFEAIPSRERSNVVQMFHQVHSRRSIAKVVACTIPLSVGKYEIGHKQVHGELVLFSEGLVLKISDEVLVTIKELELEKLKLLLLSYPRSGLWITDERGVIIDILKTNCLNNLGLKESDVVGRNISLMNAVGTPYEVSEKTVILNRLCKDGTSLRTEVVEGSLELSDGRIYHLYLDTYFE